MLNGNVLELVVLTLINSGSIFLFIILLANSLTSREYRWLAVMALLLSGWVNTAYLGYNQADPGLSLLFYRANGVFVSYFFFAQYMFYFEGYLKLSSKYLRGIVFASSTAFSLAILFSNLVISGVIQRSWGNEIVFGPLNDAFGLFAVIINVAIMAPLSVRYFKLERRERSRIAFFLIGTLLFIAFNLFFNVLLPGILKTARYQHLGDYSAVIFLALTAYAILRRRFMNVKMALTAFLIGIIGMLVITDIFFLSRSIIEQGIKFVILALFSGISVLLVRSVLNEVRQREALARANKALERSQQRYIDLATEQKDIIDVMGHEIRTPLTAIVQEIKIHTKHTLPIESELLREAKGRPNLEKTLPYLLETVKTVDRASTHAVGLVTDMLETARLDKKRFSLNYERFDLVELVRANVELMTKTVDGSADGVKYDLRFKKPEFASFEVEADKTRIGQAIYALLSNALKYRDPDKKDVEIEVTLRKRAGKAVIDIEDNGLGIDAADIAKLGKKFMRLNPKTGSNLPRPGGTGLGLFVVKGIMDHHHGSMNVSSKGLHKGSTFELEFPAER